PALLPALFQAVRPCRVGLFVVPLQHETRSALEYEQLLSVSSQRRDALQPGGPCSDHRYLLVGQIGQTLPVDPRASPGEAVIPSAGVESRPLELIEARQIRNLRELEEPSGERDILRTH